MGKGGHFTPSKDRKEKLRKQQNSSSHQLRKRGHLGRKAPSPEKEESSQ